MKCPYCGKEAEWCSNEKIYGKRYGKSYMCYWCAPCDARVGCHNNTRQALGQMANKPLREARMQAHAALDPLWQSGKYKRSTVYQRLSEAFGFQVHIGEADEKTCQEIIKSVPLLFTQ